MSLRTDGDCFQAAAEMVLEQWNMFSALPLIEGGVVVHGFPRLSIEPHLPHAHAWVEVEQELPGDKAALLTVVYDYSNGKQTEMPKEMYYKIGHIDDGHLRRYSVADLKKMIIAHETYGPWHKGPEGAL